MMISDADFEELFFEDSTLNPAKAVALDPGLEDDAPQPRHDPLQDAAKLAMMSPFGAMAAMMQVFGAQPQT
ncbi:hypothetical protein [Roseovarius dicentrarchi]|uniref:hypothetical protein n=1 Tax=Roseovarius dicentrarchi TaxID=2250573 RepID=UPI000DEB3C14|nr:hypothetical protein [Roseovarius dicentrarchi]